MFCRKLTPQFAVMTLMNMTVHVCCGVPDWHITTDGSKCSMHRHLCCDQSEINTVSRSHYYRVPGEGILTKRRDHCWSVCRLTDIRHIYSLGRKLTCRESTSHMIRAVNGQMATTWCFFFFAILMGKISVFLVPVPTLPCTAHLTNPSISWLCFQVL